MDPDWRYLGPLPRSRHYFAIRNRALADANVRDSIFRRALELDARYHDRVGGQLISRASNDAELCPLRASWQAGLVA